MPAIKPTFASCRSRRDEVQLGAVLGEKEVPQGTLQRSLECAEEDHVCIALQGVAHKVWGEGLAFSHGNMGGIFRRLVGSVQAKECRCLAAS